MIRWFFVMAFSALLFSCAGGEEKMLPRVTEITESVYSSIKVQPDSLYQVYASINGILDKNYVEEGDTIKKGSTLLQVINTTPKINEENARLSYELAEKNLTGNTAILRSIEAELYAARLQVSNDSLNYFRQKNLWSQQIGSKVEFDRKKLNYELSQNALAQLQNKYINTRNNLQTQVKQAKNNYSTSMVNSKDFTIDSKIDGKVYALYKNPGETVNTLEPLALIGSATVFIIEMLVDEVDIVKIKLGQKAVVTLDAYGGRVFTAKVSKIYPKKDERNQTFVVEALFDSPPDVLYPGLAGEANIIVGQKKETLVIPKPYVIDGNKVKTDNGLVEIEIGLRNMDSLEIVSGLSSDTWIYKPKK